MLAQASHLLTRCGVFCLMHWIENPVTIGGFIPICSCISYLIVYQPGLSFKEGNRTASEGLASEAQALYTLAPRNSRPIIQLGRVHINLASGDPKVERRTGFPGQRGYQKLVKALFENFVFCIWAECRFRPTSPRCDKLEKV